jgi:putative membrane protein
LLEPKTPAPVRHAQNERFMVFSSLQGLPDFLAYFATAIALCIAYIVVYTRVTPFDEYKLIVESHNASAALALGMSLIGFAIPLASAIYNSAGLIDCAIWGLVALIVQLIAYLLARLAHPHISQAIEQNALASALWLGFVSITAGLLSAASMSG